MSETVNHPAHYQAGGIEVIEIIHRYGLDFDLGNAVKYLLRADHKGNRLDDLRKARWYVVSFHDRHLKAQIDEPTADESTLEWNDPETIAAAKGLTGRVREVVVAILELAVFACDVDVQIGTALGLLDDEIAASEGAAA